MSLRNFTTDYLIFFIVYTLSYCYESKYYFHVTIFDEILISIFYFIFRVFLDFIVPPLSLPQVRPLTPLLWQSVYAPSKLYPEK